MPYDIILVSGQWLQDEAGAWGRWRRRFKLGQGEQAGEFGWETPDPEGEWTWHSAAAAPTNHVAIGPAAIGRRPPRRSLALVGGDARGADVPAGDAAAAYFEDQQRRQLPRQLPPPQAGQRTNKGTVRPERKPLPMPLSSGQRRVAIAESAEAHAERNASGQCQGQGQGQGPVIEVGPGPTMAGDRPRSRSRSPTIATSIHDHGPHLAKVAPPVVLSPDRGNRAVARALLAPKSKPEAKAAMVIGLASPRASENTEDTTRPSIWARAAQRERESE